MRMIIKETFTDNGHTVIEITHRAKGIKDAAAGDVMAVELSYGRVQKYGKLNDAAGFDSGP